MANFAITELADKYGCPPEFISGLLYRRKLDPKQCITKAGRRLLPESLIPQLEAELRKAGYPMPAIERRDDSALAIETR